MMVSGYDSWCRECKRVAGDKASKVKFAFSSNKIFAVLDDINIGIYYEGEDYGDILKTVESA